MLNTILVLNEDKVSELLSLNFRFEFCPINLLLFLLIASKNSNNFSDVVIFLALFIIFLPPFTN